jgi:hypothetical protein
MLISVMHHLIPYCLTSATGISRRGAHAKQASGPNAGRWRMSDEFVATVEREGARPGAKGRDLAA